jgi:predicted amidohydrolase
MSGLGGLNKSPQGVVLGLVQLQLPVVETPSQLATQAARIAGLVGKARRNLPGMDLVVFPEYALHGLSMSTDPALMCRMDGPEVAAFACACREHRIWGCFSLMEANPRGNPYNTGIILDDRGELRYRLPWEDEVVHTDGASCGFPAPERRYGGPLRPPREAPVPLTARGERDRERGIVS